MLDESLPPVRWIWVKLGLEEGSRQEIWMALIGDAVSHHAPRSVRLQRESNGGSWRLQSLRCRNAGSDSVSGVKIEVERDTVRRLLGESEGSNGAC